MKKVYIHSASSISPQGYFQGLKLENSLNTPTDFKALEPSYKEVLPPAMARRMAKITRMALMCAMNINESSQIKNWDGIISATGLGNLADTDKFLATIIKSTGGLIPPTSFTQSSHNTIAGQIALLLKNHNYNMTHVQQSMSFENALIDAQLQLNMGKNDLLVGAAEETIEVLFTLANELGLPDALTSQLGEGASFFHLSTKAGDSPFLKAIAVKRNTSSTSECISTFLTENTVAADDCYKISSSCLGTAPVETDLNATEFCGRYFTNNAFALHLGLSYLAENRKQNVLVMNTDHKGNLGLILVGRE